ncbi:MAG: toprim domain-containing protein [Shewanella algae]
MAYQEQLAFARAFGLLTEQLTLDGVIHRTGTSTKPKSRNGWYLGFVQPPFLVVGDWLTGKQETFKGNGSVNSESMEQQRQAFEQLARQRHQRQQEAIKIVNDLYRRAASVIGHPYLARKQIGQVKGLRCISGQLLVPLYDFSGNASHLVNVQQIAANGQKRFIAGGKVQGTCFPIGLDGFTGKGKIYISEGMATAATVYGLTNSPTLAAMNANNLEYVARLIRARWPLVGIIIAADDDYLTQQKTGINTGQEKALQAARTVGGMVSTPPFTQEQREAGLTDWNDYHNAQKGVA